MTDILTYFIGAFEMLFSYVNPIWHTDNKLVMIFIACVSLFAAIVLVFSFSIVKHAFIAVFNAIRKM